jgi:hypothetical protein
MSRLSIDKRMRIVSLYYQHDLKMIKNRFTVLQELAREQYISTSLNTIRKIMNKWFTCRSVCNYPKANGSTKISEYDLNRLNRTVYRDRSLTSKKLKNLLNLEMSERTIRRYLNALGWKKVRAKYCQIVTLKNRRERIAYAYAALAFRDKFTDSIFIDESTVQSTKNAYKIWNKPFANETRLGLIEKYAHPISVNLLGGISRRGPTPLIIFKGI